MSACRASLCLALAREDTRKGSAGLRRGYSGGMEDGSVVLRNPGLGLDQEAGKGEGDVQVL